MSRKIVYMLCVMFAVVSTLSLAQTNVAGNSDDPYMMPYYTGTILPVPQQVEYKDKYISLVNTAVILNDVKQDDPRLKYLLERITRYGGKYEIVETPTAEYSCIIKVNDNEIKAPEKVQGYAIKSSGRTFSLKGHDFQGLLWAISSLNQMIFIKNDKPVIRSLNVTDWPDCEIRGMLGKARFRNIKWYAHFMVAFKFNSVDFRGTIPGNARHLLDKGKHGIDGFNKEKYYQSLKTLKNLLTPLKFTWYAGCWETSVTAWKNKESKLQLNCSSEDHFNFFYNTIYKPIAEAGGNVSMQLDDYSFPVHPDDIKKFGSLAKAHLYWILKSYNKLKKINPDIRIMFCSPFYWGPKSESPYPEDREEYLKTVSVLPEAVDFYWTGPRVKGSKTEPSDVKWFTDLIKRKPFVFQNAVGIPHIYLSHYGSDPVYNLQKWYYDGYQNDIKGYFLNDSNWSNSGVLVSIADWTWNRKAYAPEKVIEEAVKKLMGPDAYPEMVKVNKTLSFFDKYYSDPVSPDAIKHAKEITATYKELKKQLAALKKASLPKQYDYWMGLPSYAVMNFAGKALPNALKNSAVNKFVKDAEASRATAQKEADLNPKRDIFRSALEFSGGVGPKFYKYKQPGKGIDIKKRLCTWIYGAESIKPSMSTRFEITPFPPSGGYKLIISGVDDDSKKRCPIKITLNDNLIFEGANPFSNKDWNLQEFQLPADKLKSNNVLTISNTAHSDSTSGPPFFMLNYAILRDTTK